MFRHPSPEKIRTAQSNDSAAAEAAKLEIIQALDPLVAKLIHRLRVSPSAVEDARQAAAVGILVALRSYRSTGGASFSTYAWNFMKGEIRGYVLKSSSSLEAPTDPDQVGELNEAAEEDRHLDTVDERMALRRLRDNVSEDERTLLWGHHVEGTPQAVTARRLGVTPMSMSRRMAKAEAHARLQAADLAA